MGEVCWCVIMYDLLAGCSCFCAPGRVAGWACLGIFPTWCSKAGADTGSMKTFFPLCDASCGDDVFRWCGNNALTLSFCLSFNVCSIDTHRSGVTVLFPFLLLHFLLFI